MAYGEAKAFFLAALASDTNECIEWPFALQANGYPKMFWKGKITTGHRAMCLEAHGECPDRHEAAHSCNSRACINPKHLSWKTPRDNHQDKIAHGTVPNGERNGASKLTQAQVAQIREQAGKKRQVDLAKEYGVTQALISKVQNGHIWK